MMNVTIIKGVAQRLALLVFAVLLPVGTVAQSFTVEHELATVTEVQTLASTTDQQITVQLNESSELLAIEHTIINNRDDLRYEVGETVVLQVVTDELGTTNYSIIDRYRLPSLWLIVALFVLIGIAVGGWSGFRSLLGLLCSVLVLIYVVLQLVSIGLNPIVVSSVGAVLIATISMYISHGLNRRTSIAILSTVLTLLLAIGIATLFVYLTQLFGMGSEEAVFLQQTNFTSSYIRGIVLGGMIIGALGVIDDITTTQTATVDELAKANARYGFKELYSAAISVGKEHVASLINTLALAYFGASLPLMLLLLNDGELPWWVMLNGEFLAEEIVRTLAGSSALLLAVPISTVIAAYAFAYGKHTNAPIGHSHHHH